MTTTPAASAIKREPQLPGQTVVVIGGSSGIGLETARRARAEGADVILTGRDPERLQRAAAELGALRAEAFDATDPADGVLGHGYGQPQVGIEIAVCTLAVEVGQERVVRTGAGDHHVVDLLR